MTERERDHAPDARLRLHRCPFCHDDVAAEQATVCEACLARHHQGCWGEGGRCGACGAVQALARPSTPLTAPERPSHVATAVVLTAQLLAVVVIMPLVLWLRLAHDIGYIGRFPTLGLMFLPLLGASWAAALLARRGDPKRFSRIRALLLLATACFAAALALLVWRGPT